MIHAGILTEDDPVELLAGWLITKMPKSPAHSLTTQLAREILEQAVPSGFFVDAQEPITTEDSEPEPDVMIVRGQRRDYAERHPYPADVPLIAEVSDSTLKRERPLKLQIYAQARIPIYWIINLQAKQVEVYSQPSGEGEQALYQQRQDYAISDTVPLGIDSQTMGKLLLATCLGKSAC